MDDIGLSFEIPDIPNKKWHIAVNTAENGVGIYSEGQESPFLETENIYVENKSIIVLIAK